jgi:hypothetical protein
VRDARGQEPRSFRQDRQARGGREGAP